MTNKSSLTIIDVAKVLALGLGLSACQSNDMSDLQTYVADAKKIKGAPIAPLPEVKPYERYLYRAADGNGRDPFQQLFAMPKPIIADSKSDPNKSKYAEEIQTHNPEELENFELDSLRMVGTLTDEKDLWGIILDHEGMVHRVSIGNYMGKNLGKVVNIFEDHIELREIVSDGQGSFEERHANVALADSAAGAAKIP